MDLFDAEILCIFTGYLIDLVNRNVVEIAYKWSYSKAFCNIMGVVLPFADSTSSLSSACATSVL
jgi:hypothetical protein